MVPRGAVPESLLLRPLSSESDECVGGEAIFAARVRPGQRAATPRVFFSCAGWVSVVVGLTSSRFWHVVPVAQRGWQFSGQAPPGVSASSSRACLPGRRGLTRVTSPLSHLALRAPSLSLPWLVVLLRGGDGGLLQLRQSCGWGATATAVADVLSPPGRAAPCRMARTLTAITAVLRFRRLLPLVQSIISEQAQYVSSPCTLTASLQPRIQSALLP